MKTKLLLWCATGLLVALTKAHAATHYVDAASTNAVPPFTNWANAAANIQDAVNASGPGDEIVVTNGVYQTGARAVYGMSNRVAVTKPVKVRSVNGPANTIIMGYGEIGENAIRCVYLTNGAGLAGFTLTNGTTQDFGDWYTNQSGGGIWCEGRGAVVSNCAIVSCSSYDSGGGALRGTLNNCTLEGNLTSRSGGGAFESALNNCMLTRNTVTEAEPIPPENGGGGAYGSALTHCTLTANFAEHGGGVFKSTLTNCALTGNLSFSYGGGAYDSSLIHCTITGNSGDGGGGGAFLSTLNDCTLTSNFGDYGGGAWESALTNCTLTGNAAGPAGGGVAEGILNNCTLMGNSCLLRGGGAYNSTLNNCTLTGNVVDSPWSDNTSGGGAWGCALTNCIIYYNGADGYPNHFGSTINYSCTTPDPGSGVGNITDEPAFVNLVSGNLRLQSNSPCINAGNNAYVTVDTDLDGLPRIVNGTVDMGAFEWQVPAQFKGFARPGTNGLAFTLSGESNRVYAVQASSNLKTWFPLGLLTNAPGAAPFIDAPVPPPSARFYRAHPVP